MSLPTNKLFTPGFRLIADDAGSYIDDLNFIRLGPEFVLTRNTADPSAAISVSAYIAAQIAAGIAASSISDVLVNQAYSAASITIPFTANKYKRIEIDIDWDAGFLSTVAMTGLSAGSYNEEYALGSNASASSAGITGANSWDVSGTSGRGSSHLIVSVPPAPATKHMTALLSQTGGAMVGMTHHCMSTDVTHDPTAIVLTLNASRVGYVYAVGCK